MKKTLMVCLALVAIGLCLFVSCNADNVVKSEGIGYISFGGAKGFTAGYETQAYDGLYWFYSAKKADKNGTTGDTGGNLIAVVPLKTEADGSVSLTKGLSGTIGPFSQGAWNFTLAAYKALSSSDVTDAVKYTLYYNDNTGATKEYDVYLLESDLVYQTDPFISVNLLGGETKSIAVNVTPVGDNGIVKFSDAYFEYEASGKSAPLFKMVATSTGDIRDSYILTNDADVTGTNVIQLSLTSEDDIKYSIAFADGSSSSLMEVGTYKCVATAYISGQEDTPLNTDTFYFAVYGGGAVTTIKGNLVENPNSYVTFDETEQSARFAIDTMDILASAAKTITVSVSPATDSALSGDGANETTVEFAEGALPATDTLDYSLKVVVNTITDEGDGGFVIADASVDTSTGFGNYVYGSIDLTLYKVINGEESSEVTSFESSTPVTVKTFIGTGLTMGNISVVYNGEGDAPTDVSYDTTTGVLTFSTTHFSSFVILYKTDVAEAKVSKDDSTKYYATIEAAIAATNSADAEGYTVTLLRDADVETALTIQKSVTLDLNGKGMEFTSVGTSEGVGISGADASYATIVVNKGITLEIKDSIGGGCIESFGGSEKGSLFSSKSYATVYLQDGDSASSLGGTLVLTCGEIKNTAKAEYAYAISIYGGEYSVIDIDGGIVTLGNGEQGYCINTASSDAELTINDATIKDLSNDDSSEIVGTYATMTMEDCVVYGYLYPHGSNSTISRSRIYGKLRLVSCGTVEDSSVYGPVTSALSYYDASSSYPILKNCYIEGDLYQGDYKFQYGKLEDCTVTGNVVSYTGCISGTNSQFKNKFDTSWIVDGYTLSSTVNSNGYYTLVPATEANSPVMLTYTAENGTVATAYFKSFADAYAEAKDKTNASITVIDDCETSSMTSIKNCDVTVNEGVTFVSSSYSMISANTLTNNGNMVCNGFVKISSAGKLTNNGTLTVQYLTVSNAGNENNGTIELTSTSYASAINADFTNNGRIIGTSSSVSLKVGAVVVVSGSETYEANTNYTWSPDADKFLKADSGAVYNETQGKYYFALSDAIADVNANDILKLNQDLSTMETVSDKTFTLDLNGHSITHSSSVYGTVGVITVKNTANLTIKDNVGGGRIYSSYGHAGVAVTDGGTFTLASGTVETASSSEFAIEIVGSASSCTISGGTVTNSSTEANGNAIKIFGTSTEADTTKASEDSYATLTITGGKISAGNGVAIIGNGTQHNTKIAISGDAVITSEKQTAIYHPQWGMVEISGGSITGGASAIEMRSGELSITGGTLTATSDEFKTQSNGSGSTTIGAAVAIAQHTTNLPITVTISGGTFKGYHALYVGDPQGNRTTKKTSWNTVSVGATAGYFASSNEQNVVAVQADAFTLASTSYGSAESANASFTVAQIPYSD